MDSFCELAEGSMTRKIYVWTLEIVYPPGSCEADWSPPDWDKSYKFRWPRNRNFLSERSAQNFAQVFAECGAKVTVLRSQPVDWSTPTHIVRYGPDNRQKEL